MAVSTIGYVPNGARKIRASRGDGVGMATKGNRNSSFLGRRFSDETARFGDVFPFSNEVRPYVPTPKPGPAVTGGVSSDSPRADRFRVVAAPARRGSRVAPPAGRRNSLSAMRRKG